MLALPAERSGLRPRLNHEVMGLFETLAVEHRVHIRLDVFHAAAPHEARNEPPAGDHVNDRELFGKVDRIVPDRQRISEEDDLHVLRDAREDRRKHVHSRRHAERRRVVFVQHDAIEAEGIDHLVLFEPFVIETASVLRIEESVRMHERRDSLLAPVAYLHLIQCGAFRVPGRHRLFGEVHQLHSEAPL